MPSRKQRQRRDKSMRHGLGRHAFEYVEIDEEGNEIEVTPEEKAAKLAPKKGAPPQRARRQPKPPQPPSVKRLGKRAALFIPVILLLTLSQKKLSMSSRIIQAVLFAVVFIAIMWLSDHLIYKMWQKKVAKEKAAGRSGKV